MDEDDLLALEAEMLAEAEAAGSWEEEYPDWDDTPVVNQQSNSVEIDDALTTSVQDIEATSPPVVPMRLPDLMKTTSNRAQSQLNRLNLSRNQQKALELEEMRSYALRMQRMRKHSVGNDLGGAGDSFDKMDDVSQLETVRPYVIRLPEKMITLPERPDIETLSFSTITLGNGERRFLYNRKQTILGDNFGNGGGLLNKSIAELEIEARQLRMSQLLQQMKQVEEDSNQAIIPITDTALWVDKYCPRSFTQLLSEERINRDVLKALKRWDRYVFKREPQHTPQDWEYDTDNRPRRKVILLAGPPGTGKTTIAHVVAKHCGYRVVEINASDDRSPEALRELLSRATQSHTLHADQRPNCVVFDEIDGMDGGKAALDMLMEVIRSPLRPAGDGKRKKGVFPLTRPLICICNDLYAPVLRELRKLSEVFTFKAPQDTRLVQRLREICVAENVRVANPGVLHDLVVATGHDVRSSINNLQFAAMRTFGGSATEQNSQFTLGTTSSSASASNDISSVVSSMLQMGLKDDHLDSYQIWLRCFSRQALKQATSMNTTRDKASEVVNNVLECMGAHGDYTHLTDGLFENVLKIESYDPHINRHCRSAEWFSWVDTVANFTYTANDGYTVQHLLGLLGPAVHCIHASSTRKLRLEWPRRDRTVHYARRQREHILRSVTSSPNRTSPLFSVSPNSLSTDVVSLFLKIITPNVRSVPLASLTPDERKVLDIVSLIMASCGVAYVPTTEDVGGDFNNRGRKKNADDSAIFLADHIKYVLEPDLTLLITFGDSSLKDTAAMAAVVTPTILGQETRAIIFAEQRRHMIMQKEQRIESKNVHFEASTSVPDNMVPTEEIIPPVIKEVSKPVAEPAQPVKIDYESLSKATPAFAGVLNSFFKRVPVEEAPHILKKPRVDTQQYVPKKATGIQFRFVQGYSNAVKRTVYLRDFLPANK